MICLHCGQPGGSANGRGTTPRTSCCGTCWKRLRCKVCWQHLSVPGRSSCCVCLWTMANIHAARQSVAGPRPANLEQRLGLFAERAEGKLPLFTDCATLGEDTR